MRPQLGGRGGIRTRASLLRLRGLATLRNGPTMRPYPGILKVAYCVSLRAQNKHELQPYYTAKCVLPPRKGVGQGLLMYWLQNSKEVWIY